MGLILLMALLILIQFNVYEVFIEKRSAFIQHTYGNSELLKVNLKDSSSFAIVKESIQHAVYFP